MYVSICMKVYIALTHKYYIHIFKSIDSILIQYANVNYVLLTINLQVRMLGNLRLSPKAYGILVGRKNNTKLIASLNIGDTFLAMKIECYNHFI